MLKLYYTGCKTYNTPQINKNMSLGGFPSSTPIQNSVLGNLFSSISSYSKENEVKETIGLILKNTGTTDINNILFWFDVPEGSGAIYQVAAVSLAQNSKGEYYMEDISNSYSLPYQAEFYDSNNEEESVSLGELKAGEMIGLWIKREVMSLIKTDSELWEDYKNSVQSVTKETVTLNFKEINLDESSSVIETQIKLIERLNRTSDFSIVLPANIRLQYIDLNSDDASVKVGTTSEGVELFDGEITEETSIEIGQTYQDSLTLYFKINSGTVNIFVYYLEI